MKAIVLFLFLLLSALPIAAQTHNAVPVEESGLYELLEMAEIRGLINRLPSARPLPRSQVARALRQISQANLSKLERAVVDDYIRRYAEDVDESFLLDGDLRVKHEIFPLKWGFYTQNEFHVDMADAQYWGTHNILGGRLHGDLGKNVSYGLDLKGQVNKVVIKSTEPYPYAWAPYTYTKVWDGGARYLSGPSPQWLMPQSLSLGWAMNVELGFSFWENRVNFRFARHRRDWGLGEGNLFLDKQARPFMGLEGTISPLKWLDLSFLFGGLEYGNVFRANEDNDLGIKEVARKQQNMFSLFQLEVAPTPWLYISVFDAVVYPMRFELGYMFPFMSKLLHQNNTGDFDNLMYGFTLGFSWPGILRTYATVYIDEWNPTIPLNSLRNQFALQAGIKASIPGIFWNSLTFQYTKIEPFTYTHYLVFGTPWFGSNSGSISDGGQGMDTGYVNNGEGLGSYLEPNSDEFLLRFHAQPSRLWSASASYRLIRHGKEDIIGSTLKPWGVDEEGNDVDGDPNGAYSGKGKSFLKDGRYEWFHEFSLGGEVDLRQFKVPLKIGLKYSLVYQYESDFPSNEHFRPAGDSERFRHLLGITLRFWPN